MGGAFYTEKFFKILKMPKAKKLKEIEKDGFKLVEGTVGVIIDSIWHNENEQILKIRFATGKTLVYKPIERDLLFENTQTPD